MELKSRVYVAGHRGLVGSAIVRALEKAGFKNLILRTRQELDLLDDREVADFFKKEKPEYVFLAAAKVGGIFANKEQPAEFIFENLKIQNNIIHNSYLTGVKKLLFLGSSCVYPRLAPHPINEESLLTGPLEETSEAYALAKIAGIKMCEFYRKQYGCNFISAMPTNLYGPNDNFDLKRSHVIPALIRKFEEAKKNGAKEMTLWGTGGPKREFLHADDAAAALLLLMNKYDDPKIINIGTGEDVTVKKLASLVKEIVGFKGDIRWDTSKPNGVPRKPLDVGKIHKLGWKHKIGLRDGLISSYKWFQENFKA